MKKLKITLKGEKLFTSGKFEDNWKNYYNFNEINDLL